MTRRRSAWYNVPMIEHMAHIGRVALATGYSKSHISRVLRGETRPSLACASSVATALGIGLVALTRRLDALRVALENADGPTESTGERPESGAGDAPARDEGEEGGLDKPLYRDVHEKYKRTTHRHTNAQTHNDRTHKRTNNGENSNKKRRANGGFGLRALAGGGYGGDRTETETEA